MTASWSGRNLLNRRFNLGLNQEDAYVSGYFGVNFNFNPEVVQSIISTGNITAGKSDMWESNNVENMLASLTEGVPTVPGGTLNVAEIVAMGGAKWGAPTSVDFGDTITLKFRELSGWPIKKFIVAWFNLIRHANSSSSLLNTAALNGIEYTKKNFSCELFYWTMKPNAKDVEMGLAMGGIYPMTDLSSQIATDLATVDGQTFDVNFHVDSMYWDHKSTAKCQELVNSFHDEAMMEYMNHR